MVNVYHSVDGQNTVRYTVSGELQEREELLVPVTDIVSLKHSPKRLRIDRVFFSLNKGMVGSLHWEDKEQSLIFPMEDKSYFSFEENFGGWSNPMREGATGNILLKVEAGHTERTWSFALKIELTKQNS